MKMPKLKTINIGQAAKESGLSVSTLRFYEEKKLIRSIGRHGLHRLFDPGVLEQLEFIALGRQAGFSLEEIRDMFAVGGRVHIDRRLLLAKAAELDRNIKRLLAVRDGLRHVANCPAPSHLECPKFRRLLRLAGRIQGKGRKRG